MPTYLSTTLDFPLPDGPGLVGRVYAAFAAAGAPFSHVLAWGCAAGLGLDEIVSWNEAKLVARFRLGFTEHVANDYRQVLLDLPPFREARLLVDLGDDGVRFRLLVAEDEVDAAGASRLRALAEALWTGLRPRSIQTGWELDAPRSHSRLLAGEAPTAALFAFVSEEYPSGRQARGA